jgi:glutathione S-transferase
MSITFYYAPRSSATRVHWALEELQVPYAKVKMDLRAGDARKPEYLKLNPNAVVPCLVDESTAIFESLAILIHLGQKYGVERDLWPHLASAQQGQALSWTVWSSVTLGAAGYRFSTLAGKPEAEPHKADFARSLALLDQRLAAGPHILGEKFSLVDVANAASLWMATRAGYDLSAHPRVAEWLKRVTARPAYLTVAAEA